MESKTPLEISIIERLRPSFHELLTNGEYYDKYHQTLDSIASCFNMETKEVFIRYIRVNPVDKEQLVAGIQMWWFGDYQPTRDAVEINRKRINERLRM